MAVSRVRTSYQKPAPIRTFGALMIAPVGIPRKLINATIDALCEMTAGLLSSRAHDADHDQHLANAERLTLVGIKQAQIGLPITPGRLQAILREIKAAQAADAKEDGFIETVLATTRRWSLALEKALKLRRQRAGKGRVTR
jgi:hypothetical protein